MSGADPVVNCLFPVSGGRIPAEHGYALYGALKQVWPELEAYDWLQVGPITPLCRRGHQTVIDRDATLLLRAPVSHLGTLFALAETVHTLDQGLLTIGRPTIAQILPAPVLYSPFVAIKVHNGGQAFYPWDDLRLSRFVAGVDDRLARLGITHGRAHVDIQHPRWLHIKEGGVSGYPVAIVGCTAAESVIVQGVGLGAKHKMGCGVLVPVFAPTATSPLL